MLRVMLLSTDLQKGGLPLRLAALAPRLRSMGIEPIVGCLAGRGPLSQRLDSEGITTFSCDARGAFDGSCMVRLAGHVRRLAPDLIHASLFHANLAARLVGRLDRRRPIITSSVTIEIERTWHRWGEWATGGWSDLHVANSRAVAEHLVTDLGFSGNRVIVIPNGVDLAAIDAAPRAERSALRLRDDVPLVIWAGRMDPVKNLETLIEAVALVNRRMPVAALLLGDGTHRRAVERRIAERGLSEVIRCPGWRDGVAGWLKAADVLALPSWTEGSPNVVLEAMACGCPVISADIPALRELIDSGRDGVLCDPGDVARWAAAIEGALINRSLSIEWSKAARRRVARGHALEAVVRHWAETYRRTMG